MRTVPFRGVLDEVASLGLGRAMDTSNQTELDLVVNRINRRLAEAWDWAMWPDMLRSQERGFAEPWHATMAYSDGDVVWHETLETYYEAAQDVPAGTVVTEAAYWTETTKPVGNLIAWEQYAQDGIGRVWKITNRDAQKYSAVRSYPFMETADGIRVHDSMTQDAAWVLFSLRCPVFSGKAHAGTVMYQTGDVVVSPLTETAGRFPQQGECYKAILAEDGSYAWQLVEFPARLVLPVTMGAAGDLLRYFQQKERGNEMIAEARAYLEDETAKLGSATGMAVNFRGYGG